MPITDEDVLLIEVDDSVLASLIAAAIEDADPDDVTPPLGSGWTASRTSWLDSFHRDRRGGTPSPAGEATWAISVEGDIVGSVRLKQVDSDGIFETGIWLTRSSRNRGIGLRAMMQLLRIAPQHGARIVRADTTSGNTAALALLERLGFTIKRSTGQQLEAEVVLHTNPSPPLGR